MIFKRTAYSLMGLDPSGYNHSLGLASQLAASTQQGEQNHFT